MNRHLLYNSVAIACMGCMSAAAIWGQDSRREAAFLDELVDWDGEELARVHCSICHIFPEPEVLPQKAWPYVLDLMGLYFGYDDGRLLDSIDEAARRELFDVERYPKAATLSPFQWVAIRDYYESPNDAVTVDILSHGDPLDLFEETFLYGGVDSPISSFVKVIPEGRGIYIGNAEKDKLLRFSETGALLGDDVLAGAFVQLEIEDGLERATMIGRMHPSNTSRGSIMERRMGDGQWKTVVDGLRRPVRAVSEDFDGDGIEELAICEFGHYQGGRLSIVRRSGVSQNEAIELRTEPGAVSLAVYREPSKAGRPHLIALNAQARQEITFYRNLGDLQFEPITLMRKPPSFGYTQIALVDLTGDGIEELVTINGDNADLPGPPLKPYHGVRVYRISPGPELEELAFLPFPGAFQAAFSDFDANGFTDIALVSFFPNPQQRIQSFGFFENLGGLRFQLRFAEAVADVPWMTIDSGDIDGDGDEDIILGSAFLEKRSDGPASGKERPSGLILRNRSRVNE